MGRREKLNKIRMRLEGSGMEPHRSKHVARLEMIDELFNEQEKSEPVKIRKPRKPRARKRVK